MQGNVTIEFGGEVCELLPEKAVLIRARNTLLVADLHLGKGKAFRMAGIPVPAGSTEHDLQRLSELITRTRAGSVIFLGDLWHGPEALSPEMYDLLIRWRQRHDELVVHLVPGNHDPAEALLPREMRINVLREGTTLGAMKLAHHPPEHADVDTIAGHLHPVIRLRDVQGAPMRMPCFLLRRRVLVLPSFGAFTGGSIIEPESGDRLFLVGPNRVMEFASVGEPPHQRNASTP